MVWLVILFLCGLNKKCSFQKRNMYKKDGFCVPEARKEPSGPTLRDSNFNTPHLMNKSVAYEHTLNNVPGVYV